MKNIFIVHHHDVKLEKNYGYFTKNTFLIKVDISIYISLITIIWYYLAALFL